VTGAQTIVASGGFFQSQSPVGIDVNAGGDILAAVNGFPVGIIRIDPLTGAQTGVSLGGSFILAT
jgi:hypothetical protein